MPSRGKMKKRYQQTPHGRAVLYSRWKRDRYLLVAIAAEGAVEWMLPADRFGSRERMSDGRVRVTFNPSPGSDLIITTLRELEAICRDWQSVWDERLEYGTALPEEVVDGCESSVPQTLEQVFERFLEDRESQVRPTTVQRWHEGMVHWYRELDRHAVVAVLKPDQVREAMERMKTVIEPVTVNNGLRVLKAVFNHALRNEWLDRAWWAAVKELPEQQQRRAWWQRHHIEQMLELARQDRWPVTAELLIALGVYLGFRKGALVSLRWEDLELDRTNPRTGDPAPICHVPKMDGGASSTKLIQPVPITRDLHQILLRLRRRSGYLLQPERHRAKRGGGIRSYRYDPVKVWKRLSDAGEAAGVPRIRFHDMRHTFASLLLNEGVSAEKVAKWMGHRDTRMVFDIYGHLLVYDDDIDRLSGQSNRPRMVYDTDV